MRKPYGEINMLNRSQLRIAMFLITLCSLFIVPQGSALEIVVGPYLQYPTESSIIVRWETDETASSEVAYGPKVKDMETVKGDDAIYHEVKLDSLEPGGYYFYQVRSSARGNTVESAVYTFQTAVDTDTPFSFIVLCDTQSSPDVVAAQAEHAWAQRPQFTLVGGDLVSDGTVKEHWTKHFFPNMHALNSRVALIPCLGNHDKDSKFYYDYFSMPEPKYCYRFRYGNTEIFNIDSQRRMTRSSEQYKWLDEALGNSTATWKIVCHHKPPYSSDENDYGDTTKERPIGGDFMLRMAVDLYEKHHVDIVWNGHIHSYERTYPLLQGKPVMKGGVVYMITGGGGGGLEKAGPWRLPFTAKVYSGHHYCLVSVHGPTLRIESYNLDNNLFDFVELKK